VIPFYWEVNRMGKSHSADLRQRVVTMVSAGQSCRAAARHFAISDSSAIKLMQRRERTGTIAPARQGRPPGSGKLSPYRDFLVAQVEAKPDITMPELAPTSRERTCYCYPAIFVVSLPDIAGLHI
jgi:transposase